MGAAFTALWKYIQGIFGDSGETLILGAESTLWLRSIPRQFGEILHQIYICSFKSLPVVLVVGAFSGMVLALQTGNSLKQFGQQGLIGGVTAIGLAREMGPNMTAFILAGLVGSAMAAELGTMKVSEEIDALEVMSIDPVRFLVMPRVIALSIAAPVLTIYNDFLGFAFGGVVGYTQLGVDYDTYINAARQMADNRDLFSGLIKALVFGVTIAMISCSEGLRAKGGALGVGQATRSAVVKSFLAIIIFNYFMTSIFARTIYY